MTDGAAMRYNYVCCLMAARPEECLAEAKNPDPREDSSHHGKLHLEIPPHWTIFHLLSHRPRAYNSTQFLPPHANFHTR